VRATTGRRRTGAAKACGALALGALLVLGVVGCDGDDPQVAAADASGPTVTTDVEAVEPRPNEPGTTVPFASATVGDCWSALESDGAEYTVLDCDEFHEYEIHAVFRLVDGPYPGDDVVAETALAGCSERFERYVGTPVDESALFTEPILPDEDSWADGDRLVVCSIVDPAGASEGSAYASGL
jgi:hypothetical protein